MAGDDVGQGVAHDPAGPGQPCGDRTRRHLLQRRDLDDGHARHVDQHDRAALGVREPPERG